MAIGMRNASNILNKLKYSPLHQSSIDAFMKKEGQDNRAVSAVDHALGKQVAAEQDKMLTSDVWGDQMARRKDKLAFARKMEKEQQKITEAKFDMAEDALGWSKFEDTGELVLGAACVGVNVKRAYDNRQRDKQWKDAMNSLIALGQSQTGNKTGQMKAVASSIRNWEMNYDKEFNI
jgi:hypothetical protein